MSEYRIAPSGAVAPSRKCLFGVTMLLIEDSQSVSEALRLFALESGARLRRADSLAAAHRHLAIYRPNVVIVDLGLPDGSGLELIAALSEAPAPFEAIVALSGNERGSWEAAALDAGAAACLEKPLASLRAFQDTILKLVPDRGAGAAQGPDLIIDSDATVLAALETDLRRALDLLERAVEEDDGETIAYCAQFLGGLGDEDANAALGAAARHAMSAPAREAAATMIPCLRQRLDPRRWRGAA